MINCLLIISLGLKSSSSFLMDSCFKLLGLGLNKGQISELGAQLHRHARSLLQVWLEQHIYT